MISLALGLCFLSLIGLWLWWAVELDEWSQR